MTREIVKGLLPVLIFTAGMVMQAAGVIDLSGAHLWIHSYAENYWAPVVLVTLMIVMYGFALPGSTMIVAAGWIFTPLWATAWTVLGGVLGGLAAYHLVRHLSVDFTSRHSDSQVFGLMRNHAGFFLLSTLRIFPGFPHSIINYSSGILRVNKMVFVASTALGFSVKGFVYTSAVYHSTHVAPGANALSGETIWPLVALSALMAAGLFVRKRLVKRT